MFYDGDIAIFFQDFGISATYTPKNGSPKAIQVIFTPAGVKNQLQIVGIDNLKPQALCMTQDIPNIQKGDVFAISSSTYCCIDHLPDGTGTTVVELSTTNTGPR
jgi:hypothetical protein